MMIDSTLWTYFINAGLVVKAVLLILVFASIMSWWAILQRMAYLKSFKRSCRRFEKNFWKGGDLSQLFQTAAQRKAELRGLEKIFHAGFKEFSKSNDIDNVRRAMRGAMIVEQEKLENGLPLLATVGSISPYAGLFGTVWGIMLSFTALSKVQQATISMVAPGIAEALIATALGLFAAIPAVVAYNRFSAEINRVINRLEAFQGDFANILFARREG